MIRIPDRAFRIIARVYRAQDRIRRAERAAELRRQDEAQRAYYSDLIERHTAGTCGGAEAGCCYVPCIPPVGWGIQ